MGGNATISNSHFFSTTEEEMRRFSLDIDAEHHFEKIYEFMNEEGEFEEEEKKESEYLFP